MDQILNNPVTWVILSLIGVVIGLPIFLHGYFGYKENKRNMEILLKGKNIRK
jgi:hypothetical protein